jgi:hypothetical protein
MQKVHEEHRRGVLSIVDPSPSAAPRKQMRRVFTLDHADGDVTVVVTGLAGSVRCSSTEQFVSISTGTEAPYAAPQHHPAPPTRQNVVTRSTDVSRSGEEFTTTDELDDFPGGLPRGMTEEEALANPDAVLDALTKTRNSMIGRLSAEAGSSDVILVPGDSN